MASKNSILLIIKQKPGISYTALLASILGDYSNINSARAALSRTLKDLESLGFIRRKKNAIFITDKGLAMLQLEMKNKIILKLNEAVLKEQSPEEIVKELSILVQRSKEDQDLLEVAKKSIGFYVSDIERVQNSLEKKISQLSYINKVLKKQIEMLKELGFRDRVILDKSSLAKILKLLLEKEKPKEVIITAEQAALEKLAKISGVMQSNALIVPASDVAEILDFIKKEEIKATVMFQDFLIKIAERCEIIAPAKKLAFLKL